MTSIQRREKRQQEARDRQMIYAMLSIEEKRLRIALRPGKSARELARLHG